MTSLPLISHRMFVAAIQEPNESRPAPASAEVLDVPSPRTPGNPEVEPAPAAVSDAVFPEAALRAMGS